MTAPEFSRRIALDRVDGPMRIEADMAERAALCARFGWIAIELLSAEAALSAKAGGYEALGMLHARLAQPCVVTGEAVPATIDAPFHIRFVASDALASADEIELSADDLDTMEHDGAAIDLGEAIAQTLALAVDPFPRSAGADATMAGLGAEEAGPFAGLKDLLKRD